DFGSLLPKSRAQRGISPSDWSGRADLNLRRLAGVSEGAAEREPAAEIPSAARDLPVRLVGTGRFELPTPRTPSECSTRLSHVPTGWKPQRPQAPRWGYAPILTSATLKLGVELQRVTPAAAEADYGRAVSPQ